MTGSTPGLDVLARELGDLITFYPEFLVAPIFGVLLRIRSKRQICSDYDPIFAILVKKIGAMGNVVKYKGYLRKNNLQTKLPLFCSDFY